MRQETQAEHKSDLYKAHRERMAQRASEQSESARDIGRLPEIADKDRRMPCETSFKLFCETYLKDAFNLAWSKDHLRAIEKIESAVLRGELFAFAMPRGSGKSTLVESAALWALLFGHRQFVMIVGADQTISGSMLDSLKAQIENNELLLEDFPAACYPIKKLDRISQRAKGQTYQGKPTLIEWTADKLTLPWIPGAKSSGGAVRVAGITGRIRGIKHARPDGSSIRPQLVLIDDPQTDESAGSPSQVATRERILSGAILGLGGPGTKMSGLCTVTVIRPDDLADKLLDRNAHPEWQGEKSQLVYQWPSNDSLWSEYAELRRAGQKNGNGTTVADEFYERNQEEMDLNSEVAWPERKNEEELSAIQHAWNLRIDRGETAFFAEYQNAPLADDISTDRLLRSELVQKLIPIERGIVPEKHNQLTAFIDVQQNLLYWIVASFSDSFGGHLVAYGTYPDQGVSYFDAHSAKKTLALATSNSGFEASLHEGLANCCDMLLGRDWMREDDTAMRVGRLLIDANWGQSTSVVRTFAKRSSYAGLILPSHGKFFGASSVPINDVRHQRGDKVGLHWRVGKIGGANQRSVLYDTNFWKTFCAARLRMSVGDPEALTLHKNTSELLVDHFISEYPVRTEARGRVVDEWKQKGRENHWWDCFVGCCVAASVLGLEPSGIEVTKRRKRVSIPKNADGKRVIQVKRYDQ